MEFIHQTRFVGHALSPPSVLSFSGCFVGHAGILALSFQPLSDSAIVFFQGSRRTIIAAIKCGFSDEQCYRRRVLFDRRAIRACAVDRTVAGRCRSYRSPANCCLLQPATVPRPPYLRTEGGRGTGKLAKARERKWRRATIIIIVYSCQTKSRK